MGESILYTDGKILVAKKLWEFFRELENFRFLMDVGFCRHQWYALAEDAILIMKEHCNNDFAYFRYVIRRIQEGTRIKDDTFRNDMLQFLKKIEKMR